MPFSRVRDVGSLELAQSQLRGLAVRQGDKDEWGCARVVDHELVFDALEVTVLCWYLLCLCLVCASAARPSRGCESAALRRC